MGVVYHANYLVWCEMGRTDYIRAGGTTYAAIERGGITLAVADASLRFHAPARYDDLIRVETRLPELRSRTITFDYLVANADSGERLVTARTVLISLDAAGRPRALPGEVRDILAQAMAG